MEPRLFFQAHDRSAHQAHAKKQDRQPQQNIPHTVMDFIFAEHPQKDPGHRDDPGQCRRGKQCAERVSPFDITQTDDPPCNTRTENRTQDHRDRLPDFHNAGTDKSHQDDRCRGG